MLASVDGVEASPGPASASRCARKSRGHRPPGGCPRGCDVDELLVDELAKTQFGQLSPEPGVLDAAERQLCSGPHRLIDEDHAALNPLREPPTAIDVGCEDGDAQAEWGAVGNAERLFLGIHNVERGNRTGHSPSFYRRATVADESSQAPAAAE